MAREPKELTEEELNLRRKARRRLIGATALTLAVVVILPMVLESQPKPSGQDIELRIPTPEQAGEFVPGVIASGVPVSEVPASAVMDAAPQAASGVVAADAQPAAIQTPPAVEKAVEPAPAKPSPSKPAEAVSTKIAETVSAKPAAKPEEKSANKQESAYAVQVGAYSSAATAKQEVAKLKKWGYSKAYTEQAGNKTRVRVGPYADRAQADKVRAMLEKHGLHPVVAGIK